VEGRPGQPSFFSASDLGPGVLCSMQWHVPLEACGFGEAKAKDPKFMAGRCDAHPFDAPNTDAKVPSVANYGSANAWVVQVFGAEAGKGSKNGWNACCWWATGDHKRLVPAPDMRMAEAVNARHEVLKRISLQALVRPPLSSWPFDVAPIPSLH